MADEPTPALANFLERYVEDDNEWWRLDAGHHQNLFDAAVSEMQFQGDLVRALRGKVDRLRAELDVERRARLDDLGIGA